MRTINALLVIFAILISFVLPADSGEYTVFGPMRYDRTAGKPANESGIFSSPVAGSNFTLKILSGNSQGGDRVSSATLTINGSPVASPSDFNQQVGSIEKKITLDLSNNFSVLLEGVPGSFLTLTVTGEDKTPPLIAISNPMNGATTNAARIDISGTVSDDTPVNVMVNGTSAAVSGGIFTVKDIPLTVGENKVIATAIDLGGNVSSFEIVVIRQINPPDVTGMSQSIAAAAIVAAKLAVGNITLAYSDIVPAGSVISQNPTANAWISPGTAVDLVISKGPSTVAVPNVVGISQSDAEAAINASNLHLGTITTAYSNSVPAGKVTSQSPAASAIVLQGTSIAIVVSGGPAPVVIPPDPSTVAPKLDNTVATSVATSTAFLYSGENPIQTGVAIGTIELKRATVLRGKVSDRDGNPLSGVTITILNHPEFGQTITRTDGMFDMAANGGGILTVNYFKPGYMAVQRQINTPWNGFAWLPDVVMLPLDTQVTTVDLSSSVPIQVARGSIATDVDGSRQATIFFNQGTSAQMALSDGTTQTLNSLSVRATEYTIGPNGPKAMPGALPPTSAYTYAVELSADEAVAAGATSVRFSKPVNVYVENFLNFPIGGIVPAGFYDSSKAAWIPSDNGRVIKILSLTGGYADIDTDGSGLPADVSKLATLGITNAERLQLAALYVPGQSLWRVPVSHFTPWDFNWPFAPPADANPPDMPAPDQGNPVEDPDCKSGSIIECQNRTLGESIPIAGTSLSLNYRSDRVPGRKSRQTLSISVSGATVPASLAGIILEIKVAGRKITKSFPPSPNPYKAPVSQ